MPGKFGNAIINIWVETMNTKKGMTGFQLAMIAIILVILYFLIGQVLTIFR